MEGDGQEWTGKDMKRKGERMEDGEEQSGGEKFNREDKNRKSMTNSRW